MHIDPNFDPRILDGLSLAALLTTRSDDGGERRRNGISFTLKWAPVGICVSVVIFMVQQYQAWNAKDTEREKDIAVIKEQIRELRETNMTQDKMRLAETDTIVKRLDIQRAAIDALTKQMFDHATNDDKVYMRKPVR